MSSTRTHATRGGQTHGRGVLWAVSGFDRGVAYHTQRQHGQNNSGHRTHRTHWTHCGAPRLPQAPPGCPRLPQAAPHLIQAWLKPRQAHDGDAAVELVIQQLSRALRRRVVLWRCGGGMRLCGAAWGGVWGGVGRCEAVGRRDSRVGDANAGPPPHGRSNVRL